MGLNAMSCTAPSTGTAPIATPFIAPSSGIASSRSSPSGVRPFDEARRQLLDQRVPEAGAHDLAARDRVGQRQREDHRAPVQLGVRGLGQQRARLGEPLLDRRAARRPAGHSIVRTG